LFVPILNLFLSNSRIDQNYATTDECTYEYVNVSSVELYQRKVLTNNSSNQGQLSNTGVPATALLKHNWIDAKKHI